jgi:hypothetical protein
VVACGAIDFVHALQPPSGELAARQTEADPEHSAAPLYVELVLTDRIGYRDEAPWGDPSLAEASQSSEEPHEPAPRRPHGTAPAEESASEYDKGGEPLIAGCDLKPGGSRHRSPLERTVELLIVQSGRWRLMSSGGKAEDKDGARERRQARRGLAGARAVHSGQAQVLYDAQFAGRAAIEISGPGPIPAIFRESYYVAPRTHQPLGLVQRGAGKAGETWTTRFITYRLLPGTVANRALVTVPGTHPDATIDTRPADYTAASCRLSS